MKFNIIAADKRKATTNFFEQNQFSDAEQAFRIKKKGYAQKGSLAEMINAANIECNFQVFQGKYKKAIYSSKKIFQNHRKILKEYPILEKDLHQNLAEAYFYRGDYVQSEAFAFKALKIRPTKRAIDQFSHAENHRTLGKAYWKQGFFYEAIYLYVISLQIIIQTLGEKHYQVGKLLNLIGIALLDVDPVHYEKAMALLNRALAIYEKSDLGPRHLYFGSIYNDLGYGYLRLRIVKKRHGDLYPEFKVIEKSFFQNALGIFEGIYGKDGAHRHIATVYKYLGRLYKEKEGDYSVQILEYLEKELEIRRKALPDLERHPTFARTYNRMGRVHFQKGDYLKAAEFAQMAIIRLYNDFGETSKIEKADLLLTPALEESCFSDPELLKGLRNKAEAMIKLFEEDGDIRCLNTAYDSLRRAIATMEKIWNNYRIEESKLLLSKNTRTILELSFETIILLRDYGRISNQNEEIFRIINRSKAVLLREKLNVNDIFHNQKEGLEDPPDIKNLVALTQSIIDKGELAANLHWDKIRLVKNKAPSNGVKPASLSLEKLIEGLDPDPPPAILSYFMGDSALYGVIFYRHKEKIRLEVKKLQTGSYANLKEFRNACDLFIKRINYDILENQIKTAFNGEMEEADENLYGLQFRMEAYELYTILIEPFDLKQRKIKRLYIIPDEELFFIPFETLISNLDLWAQYHEIDYVLYDFIISYHTSIAILDEKFRDGNDLALCSSFLDVDAVEEIGRSAPTIEGDASDIDYGEAIRDLFRQKLFEVRFVKPEEIDQQTLLNFIKQFDIINITAHGVWSPGGNAKDFGIILKVEENGRQIILTEQKVKGERLMDVQKLELVVLNACHSGRGPILKGEGVLAMSRAFLSFGAKNIIYSLIALPRQTAHELLFYFFQNVLERKMAYGQALQAAKIRLAKEENYSPVNWAGLVLMGNQKSVFKPNSAKIAL